MAVFTDSGPSSDDGGPPRRPARAVLASLGLTVAALLASLAGGIALAIPVVLFELDLGSPPVLAGLTAAGQVGFLLVGYAYARYAGIRVGLAVPDGRDLAHFVGGTVLALAVAVGLSALLASLGLLPGSVLAEAGTADPTLFLWLAGLSVVLVAPAEEFLFRGVVQTRLRRAFGRRGAVLGSSLLFGSMHLANYTGRAVPIVAGALLITAVGAVFGTLYERTRNLAVPVLTHATYNAVLFGIAFLTV